MGARDTTWRLILTWDGAAYVGWQHQPSGVSIQGTVEAALRSILGGEAVSVIASGRTDAGVHALRQVAAFRCHTPRTPRAIMNGLNAMLPPDIACLEAAIAPTEFHPRRWAIRKRYRYRLLVRSARCPHRRGRVWHLRSSLDVRALRAAARGLVGEHDFTSFRAAGCGAAHALRTIEAALVADMPDDEVHVTFTGSGFLRHQVRIMVGTLVEIGRGRWGPEHIPALLAARDRTRAGRTAPAHGLALLDVELGPAP